MSSQRPSPSTSRRRTPRSRKPRPVLRIAVKTGFPSSSSPASSEGRGKARGGPAILLGIPDSRLSGMLVRQDDIEITVVIQTEQANAVVLPVGGAQRMAEQQIFIQALLRLAKGQELDFRPVFL